MTHLIYPNDNAFEGLEKYAHPAEFLESLYHSCAMSPIPSIYAIVQILPGNFQYTVFMVYIDFAFLINFPLSELVKTHEVTIATHQLLPATL